MLNHLRRKLTWNYSTWFFITLLIVLAVLFLLVKSMLFETANEDIQDILHYELEKYKGQDAIEVKPEASPSLYFSVVLSKSAHSIRGVQPAGKDAQTFSKFVRKQPCCRSEGKLKNLKGHFGDEMHIIYASARIDKNSTLFVGKNISSIHEKIEHWFFSLSLIGLAALMISVIMGDRLARKAMKPIIQNIEGQKKFIADASHELRTPISIFSASLEVLENEERDKLSPFSQETLNELKDEVRQMNGLVANLLMLAQEDAGQLKMNKESFSFAELAGQLVHQYERLYEGKRQIALHVPDDKMLVEADRVRIKELLHVLLDNACKYSVLGSSISITVQKEEGRILSFTVEDKGAGIPAEEIPYLFDRFYRVEKGRSRQAGGAGLGLSIAKAITDLHDGTIKVSSWPGEGTIFSVRLPILANIL
ncbi:HAMP domain-containing histidine kinase [Fictibacillus sp. KIGAM418]|uniref:histidine kinase n=1 Tax=Fictibacillus marinisediminis TaxID=2878389 RepID=A0A9X1XG74_9BACL|nr:HAMP domain-containing sensor histidine kinase [Fictibacillus marinisediminis]MCK6259325.1 HAMP domain-containing histidine kinase [Fictibacillus marinisediminis]